MNAVRDIMLPVSEGELVAGRYRVTSFLGTGTTGVVACAEDLDARETSHAGARASRPDAEPRLVALKLLWPHLAATGDGLDRFHREQDTAQRLTGEHVPRVLDAGVHVRIGGAPEGPASARGIPFFVMELVEGRDLAAVLREREGRGGLSQSEVVEIALQVLEGLGEAHAMGIVHRDIKPANLLLTARADGSPLVKILDFGMSKGASRDDALPLGSPAYAAPEQIADGATADPRSDIWSLGVVLYELLAARLPFDAEGVAGLLIAVMTSEPEPLTCVDAELAEVVHRCLARDRDARFATVADVAEALAPFGRPDAPARAAAVRRRLAAAGTPEPPPAWPTRRGSRPSYHDDVLVQRPSSIAPVAMDAPDVSTGTLRALRPSRARAVAAAVAVFALASAGGLRALDVSPAEIGAWAHETVGPSTRAPAAPTALPAPISSDVAPTPASAAPVEVAAPAPAGAAPVPPTTYTAPKATPRHRAPARPVAHPAPRAAKESDDLRKFLDQRK
ncbi:MAG: serine/threonine-protein kinase [Polyangiaceae bacterium]